MDSKKLFEEDGLTINVNYISEEMDKADEEQKKIDNSSTIVVFTIFLALFICAVWYLLPWFASITSVFKLILTSVSAVYVYQCIIYLYYLLKRA